LKVFSSKTLSLSFYFILSATLFLFTKHQAVAQLHRSLLKIGLRVGLEKWSRLLTASDNWIVSSLEKSVRHRLVHAFDECPCSQRIKSREARSLSSVVAS